MSLIKPSLIKYKGVTSKDILYHVTKQKDLRSLTSLAVRRSCIHITFKGRTVMKSVRRCRHIKRCRGIFQISHGGTPRRAVNLLSIRSLTGSATAKRIIIIT